VKKEIVILTGIVLEKNKKKGYMDIAVGKKSNGIQILRLRKSVLPFVATVAVRRVSYERMGI